MAESASWGYQKDIFYQEEEEEIDTKEILRIQEEKQAKFSLQDVAPNLILSNEEAQQIFERDSPELLGLLKEAKKWSKKLTKLYRILPIVNNSYTKNLYTLILNYTQQLIYYILLKSKGINSQKLQAHPVISSILWYKHKIQSMYNKNAWEEIKNLCKMKKKDLLKLMMAQNQASKKVKKSSEQRKEEQEQESLEEQNPQNNDLDKEELSNQQDKKVKDKLKEIIKNRGLTRRRKKIERNTRVKNRYKYGKKEQKRKSEQGLYLKTKQEYYEGEHTGIRKNLIKSSKIQ